MRDARLFRVTCAYVLVFIAFISFLTQGAVMRRRNKMSRSFSKKVFSKGAQRVHPKNGLTSSGNPMRGGIRL